MSELNGPGDLSPEWRRDAPDKGRRSLVRLRWGLRIAALIGLAVLELFYVFVLNRSAGEVLLDLVWGVLFSLGLIQVCFSVVFRLYDNAVADRQHMALHLVRLHQLYALSQRLMASFQRDFVGKGLLSSGNELSSVLRYLTEVFDAQRATLLLLDEGGQTLQFVQIGLASDTGPGPRPAFDSPEDARVVDMDSGAWTEFLMPGVEQNGPFVAVPVVAGERLWGYLALAGAKLPTSQDKSLLHTFAANLGVILESDLLLQDTQQRLAEAATLAEVSHAISSKLTVEELLPLLAESLTSISGSTGCFIVLRHPQTDELALAAIHGSYEDEDRSLPLTGDYARLARASLDSGQAIVVEDVSNTVHIASRKAEHLPDKSLLALPLIAQGRAIGAAIVGESRARRCFSGGEIGRLMVVGNQGAVAIANARLFRELEQRLVELGTLAEISRVVFSELRAPDIYQRVVDELARAFGYPYVAFYQVGEDGLELGAQVGYDAGSPPARIPLGSGLVGDSAATGRVVYVPDIGAQPGRSMGMAGVVSQVALPLRKNGQVLGVLSVESHSTLTEADLSLLQSVSYQVSTAVENARLYAAEQREREVARTLLQIAGDLSGTLLLEEVLGLILERLRVVVPYESAAIGLLAGDVCHLAAANAWARAERFWGNHLAPNDLPLVARVLREAATVIVGNTLESDEWVAIEGGEDIRSWMGVPLVVQDRTIGLLMLNHVAPEFYGQEAAQLALAFAQHAALAIDNARLYEQIQATLREQTLLHEMTTAVSSTLDAGRVLRLLAERLVTVLGVTSARIATLDDEMLLANLVAIHSSTDANDAEQMGDVGEVYDLALFPVTTRKLEERMPLQVTAEDELGEWHGWMRQRAGQAMLLLPLVARDRVTGFVELWDSRSRRTFTEAEIALAQTLINPAAVAIDNAILFAETQRSISEMMLLYDIAVAAASTLELDTILQSVVKTLQFRVLEKSVVNIWLLDEAEKLLRLRAHAGELDGVALLESQRLDEGLCGQAVQTGQPVLVNDSTQDLGREGFGPGVRSILCVPLAWGQRVVGVLQAVSLQEDAFSSHELRLLRTMAGNLAVAIENVRLFAQLKHSEEALMLRNQALERANDRLQELDRLKSAFIASVSHELRTPLNSIIGFSEVVLDGLAGDVDPLANEYLGYIHDSGKHLLDLINDILDLSRMQAGRMALSLGKVDVMEVVEEARATLAPMIAKKQHTFIIEQEQPVPHIVADRFRLKQILLNLVSNACKFTQEGGHITVCARLTTPDTLRLDVADDGPGILLEDQAMIFEEFRQSHTTRSGEGTGLGLAITRRLVDLHGGRIWVESGLGDGATFTVLLPLAGPGIGDGGKRDEEEERMT
jgi:GAF domain-containing protein